jgi:hypothetical protein
MGESLAVLEYHRDDSYTNADDSGRYTYYGLSGIPTAKFNGTSTVVGGWSGMYGTYVNAYNSEMQSPSPCTLNFTVDYDVSTRYVKVKSTVFAVDAFENARLRCALAQSHIHAHWGGLDSLHHVVRKMLPDYYGVGMPPMNPGDTFVDSQTYTLRPRWEEEDFYVVVFVQRETDKKVLRSAKIGSIMPPQYGDANGDGDVSMEDAIFVVNYLFREGPAPDPLAHGDSNDDCVVNVADVVYLINYLFRDGPAPLQGCA